MSSLEIGALRPVDAVLPVQPLAQNAAAGSTASSTVVSTTPTVTSAGPQVQTSLSVSSGTSPVDQSRVDEIRKAVQSGNYPLVPAEIGDAMVAAGLLLRKQG